MTTTTSTTEEQYRVGVMDKGLLRGVGGEVEPSVDVTYSTKDDGIPLGNGQLTITVTTIETQYFRRIGVSIGKNIDISIYEINQTINTGRNIRSLEISNKTTLLQYKVQHIIKREIQPIKTVIKPITQKIIQPILQREIQPIVQKEIQQFFIEKKNILKKCK